MNNKLSLTAISFLANFVMAGFATQFGMLIDPIAAKFGADVNQVASIFSCSTAGRWRAPLPPSSSSRRWASSG
ncbi:hypothetical protein [Aeromonas jandaei]|uniref:hypothetical protein n=1 Tax=Aeromonas jandaei TaxID=650 RepID=UPI001F380917|nr:hypothetical protein [Aeromonas jandaei]